jgi:signal transduction histidine kinase
MIRIKLLFILLLASTISFAQSLHVENYTPANGLLDTRVIKIFQDKRGLIYFLTWEGISIFDGQRFENISEYNGESLGLVNDMIQWKGDTCYVFTFQKGIFKLIHNRLIKDNRFDVIAEPNQVLKSNEADYIITSNMGLYRWRGQKVEPLSAELAGGLDKAVDYAAINKNMLVFTDKVGKNLKALNLSTTQITSSISDKVFGYIRQDDDTTIFVQTDKGWMQLDKEALKNGKLVITPLFFNKQLLPDFTISNIHFSQKKIWLEDYRKGYLLLDPATSEKEFYPLHSEIKQESSIVFNDKENNYWFVQFSKQVQKAYYTKLKKAYENSISSASGILTDEEGNAIVQSANQVYLLQNNPPTSVPVISGSNPFFWQHRSWIFKTASLIQSNKDDKIDLRKAPNTDSSFRHSVRIAFDKYDRLLIAGNSLYVVEKNLLVHAVALPSFTDNIVTDDENNYWAFARNSTATSYTLKDNAFLQRETSIQLNNVGSRFAIHWSADTFAIGTRHRGIVWVKINNGKAIETGRLNTSKGLSNNFVSGLVKKSNWQLYAATEFGLDEIIINSTDTIVENLSAANNLHMPFSYVIKNNKEEIFARSNENQLWAVTEKENQSTSFIPSAWFNDITVNGKAIDDSVTIFNYNENNFRFMVTAPCFTNAANMRFAFLLETDANKWQQQSKENFYSINNLAPGNYTLIVTVNYSGKIYPDKKVMYAFTINSPLWKRWWFIVLSVLLVGLLFWAIIRTYYRRKLATHKAEAEKQQAIEKERNRISRDMHDDLGSGLTTIAILSEVAKKQLGEPEKAKEQLEKISFSSRELVDNLQDIIWVLNPKNDTLESLSAYMREYTLKFFESLGVKVQFIYPEEFSAKQLSEEKRRNVFLTVKETLNNIAKHACCNEVIISIIESNEHFEISIKDDGKGFDAHKIRLFANGLKNMQGRIEQAGGDYQIQSTAGKGTIVIITMPA